MPDRLDKIAENVERQILTQIDRHAGGLSVQISKLLSEAAGKASIAIIEGRGPVSAIEGLSRSLYAVMWPKIAAMADAGARQVQELAGEIERKDAQVFIDTRTAWAKEHAAKKVVAVSDSVREAIRRKVERASRQNMGPRELAKDIADTLGGKAARKRAMRIARTELHQAANYGQFQEADRMRRESGKTFVKVWRSTRDARTRAAHRMADGQTKPVNEPFVVGGELMMHPGDASASARNVVNCRCTQTIVPQSAASQSGRAVVRQTAKGIRSELGQAHMDAAKTGRVFEIIRGGAHGPKASEKLIDSLAREAIAQNRALAAPRTMTSAERAAFEKLGKRSALRLVKDKDLADGFIQMHPRPPMLLQIASDIDDTIRYQHLINFLYNGLEVAQ